MNDPSRLIDIIDIEISKEQRKVIREMSMEAKVAIIKMRAEVEPSIDSSFIKLLLS